MKKCALYARVSSNEQVKGFSIDAQLESGHNFATQRGWSVASEYVDAGLSGTTDERPQFKQMIREALSGQFEIIVVHAFDRFSRNIEDAVVYKSLLRRDEVQVVSVTEQIDNTPLGFIYEGIIDLFAAYYSINLAVKIRSGLTKSVQSGRWPWSVPIGYKKTNNLAKITEAGAGIQMAFREFATGNYTLETWSEAAYHAGLRGHNGNRIRPGGWSRIFHNRFYIGRLVWNDLDVQGIHKPLVDEDTFNRVQEILRENDRYSRPRKHEFYLLSGLCWSLDANDRMYGANAKNHHRYYRSRTKIVGGTVKHYVPVEVLESQIERVLSEIFVAPQDIDTLDIDPSLRLALSVTPHLGAIYRYLDTDLQRQALLKLVIKGYGLKISGHQIIEVEPNPPFCFGVNLNSTMGIAGVEYIFFAGAKA